MRKRTSRFGTVRRTRAVVRVLVVAGVLVGSGLEGWAQQPVGQNGHLFDANPQIGASRYNSTVGRPVSPLLEGNAMAAGQLGRGMSLRSVSPIPSWNAFRAPLGSSTLSNFTRDTVSTGQAYAPGGGLVPRLYFDPSRTVPSAGFLQGYYANPSKLGVNTSRRLGSSGSVGVNPWGGTQYGVPPSPRSTVPRGAGSAYAVPPVNNALTASIFGVNRPGLPGPLSGNRPGGLPEHFGAPAKAPAPAEAGQESVAGGPLDLRLWLDQKPEPPRAWLDVFSQGNASDLLGASGGESRGFRPGIITPGVPVPGSRERAARVAANSGLQPAQAGGLSMLPGNDVFTDMRLALEMRRNPEAPWLREMAGARVSGSPTMGQQQQQAAAEQTSRFLARVLTAPLTSFVGQAPSPLNDALRRAEAAMELGRYREAIRYYDRAATADPANPLPLIGRGHALLAAGEYVSAAVSLISGLRRYPDLGSFRIDLTSLMGGGEIVDIRRSDLMRRLAAHEDAYLRFLLGYIEVNSGMPDAGLRDLEQAATRAEPGSVIRTYAEIVRRRFRPPARPASPTSRVAAPAASQPGKGRP